MVLRAADAGFLSSRSVGLVAPGGDACHVMAECITVYHTAQYANPLVLLPKSGYIYHKSDRANVGYYILQTSAHICAMLRRTLRCESRFFCTQAGGMIILHIAISRGSFLVARQFDVHGKRVLGAIVKLQRWFWHGYKVPRRAAVAMCLHKRLGHLADLGCIGADMLQLIVS